MRIWNKLRHLIGIGLRRISDILLSDIPKASPKPPPPEQQNSKQPRPTTEPHNKPPKRDRSKYDPTKHNTYYVAAYAILREMLKDTNKGHTVKDFEPSVGCSPSSIRSACKKMVDLRILRGEGYPAIYYVIDPDYALEKYAEYQKKAHAVLPSITES